MLEWEVLCFIKGKPEIAPSFLVLLGRAMRSFHEQKSHNDVAIGLSFVAVALLVLGFMGMAQHLELTSF